MTGMRSSVQPRAWAASSPSISARCASTPSTSSIGERVGGTGSAGQHLAGGGALRLGLVEQAERPLAGVASGRPRSQVVVRARGQTRVTYSPVRVSTLTRSPRFTNSGTWTT